MGLDQHAYRTKDESCIDENRMEEIAYWRKYYDLNEFVSALPHRESFHNRFGDPLYRLDKEKLEAIRDFCIDEIVEGHLSRFEAEKVASTLLFVEKGLESVAEGYIVYYSYHY